MSTKQKTLFEAFAQRARIAKQGEIAMIVIDGGGAMIVAMDEFITAQKWAQSRVSSGNVVSDRGRILEQFQVMVTRPGSFTGTKGNDRQLYKMAKKMRAAGHDLGEWQLPPELKVNKLVDPDEIKAKPKADAEIPADPDAAPEAPGKE
ncbi:hypothetical protein D0B54_14240 [Solimonas sp. K1W22B-7]|uniref:hypothetical protein n=1 Tax=Solimonas sp. K1W22B-7 TaxID=2303331 RepID=UPI000E32EAA7|nr:hypothetical protein [Solimonas sp. K1W22B-7]AXQ29762.1 hypothetical protein D0B54_14240 [Solimonas sp. K1W22B-7]